MKQRTFIVATICAVALCTLLLVAATPAQAHTLSAPTTAGGVITYTVRVGDTWAKISNLFGVSSARLLDLNERRTTNRIALFAGEVLKIPVELGYTPSYNSPFLYKVQTDDTVESVTRKFYQDKFTLLGANGLPTSQITLTPGQVLFMPAGPHRYQVQRNDTLQGIAAMFGSTADKLLPVNPQLANGKIFYAGMYVYIPIVYDVNFKPAPGFTASPSATTSTVTSNVTLSGNGLPTTIANPEEVMRAANAGVTSAVETISLPQNVVNLNQKFEVRYFIAVRVQRDPSRENGASVVIAMRFRGGSGTYTIRPLDNRKLTLTGIYVNADGNQLWNEIEFPVETTCNGNAVGDLLITTSNETKYQHYEIKNISCPK